MHHLMTLALAIGLALPAMAAADEPARNAQTQNDVEITHWQVPWERTRPRDPDLDAQGRVWFVGQTGDYLAHLNPDTGEFRQYDLPDGTGPHNLIIDQQGMVWYAGNRAAHIGRLDPESGEITRYDMPDERARDPHTLIFDQQGDIWFTVQHGNMVGKLDTGTGEVRLIDVPTPRARPYGIVVDQDNRPWIVLLGTNKLATVDPQTMELEEIELPRAEARPRRLAVTDDRRVWYADYAAGHLGMYDPQTRQFDEWQTPSGENSRPYAMAADHHNRLWLVESGPTPHRLVGFDPQVKQFFSTTEIEHSDGSTRHMVHHDGELWFGLDTDYIARAKLPAAAATAGATEPATPARF